MEISQRTELGDHLAPHTIAEVVLTGDITAAGSCLGAAHCSGRMGLRCRHRKSAGRSLGSPMRFRINNHLEGLSLSGMAATGTAAGEAASVYLWPTWSVEAIHHQVSMPG